MAADPQPQWLPTAAQDELDDGLMRPVAAPQAAELMTPRLMTPRVTPELRRALAARRVCVKDDVAAHSQSRNESKDSTTAAADADVHYASQVPCPTEDGSIRGGCGGAQTEPPIAPLVAFAMDFHDVDEEQESFFPTRDWAAMAESSLQKVVFRSFESPAAFNAAFISPPAQVGADTPPDKRKALVVESLHAEASYTQSFGTLASQADSM